MTRMATPVQPECDGSDEPADPAIAGEGPESSPILGVPVSLVDMKSAVGWISRWVLNGEAKYVCCREVPGLMLAVRDPELMLVQCNAAMVTPDGMPLVWLGKLRSKQKIDRVYGPDLMAALCDAGRREGLRHYFYGGKPGVVELLVANLTAKYPGLSVAGCRTPPFRALTPDEDAADVAAINRSGAQIVWVGLGTPKQDFWMRDHVGRIEGATLIGVGAAFDFHAGTVAEAPKWMQRSGLQWLHRIASEPGRLGRRYLATLPHFVVMASIEQLAMSLGWKDAAKRRPASTAEGAGSR
jgi:N-acetylglucosaminyldiphosphoundecaprenol N-acetyl-beta-D-mannosaminyltransferase